MRVGLRTTLLASVLLHMLGFTALSMVGAALWSAPPPPHLIAMEVLLAPPSPTLPEPLPSVLPEALPPAPAVPLEAPAVAPPVEPRPSVEQVTPPKLVEKPTPERLKPPTPVPVQRKTPPPPKPLPRVAAAPTPSRLLLPSPVAAREAVHGNSLGPPAASASSTLPPPPVEGGEAGAGQLFDRGNVSVVPGAGAGGGSGGPGRSGLGTGGSGESGSTRISGLSAGRGDGSGIARPLGGYQVKPRYPEAARRQGIEGTTLLRIHVSERGLVEDVFIERSAGHQDLDFAAMEAVKKWRFEPARQGSRPVAIWVMLPVRFTLK